MRTIACLLSMRPCGHALRASRCMFRAARLVAGRFLRLRLLPDHAGRPLQLLPFFLDDAALHQKAGRDEDGEARQNQGEDQQQQGRARTLVSQPRRSGAASAAFRRPAYSRASCCCMRRKIAAFGAAGTAAALEFQGGRQALFQTQAHLGEPGDVHRVDGLWERRDRAGEEAEARRRRG